MNTTIDSVEYSDGFGRSIQSRIQAEDIIFGDASSKCLGGNSGLDPLST